MYKCTGCEISRALALADFVPLKEKETKDHTLIGTQMQMRSRSAVARLERNTLVEFCRRRDRQNDVITSAFPRDPSTIVSPYTRLTGTSSIRGIAASDVSCIVQEEEEGTGGEREEGKRRTRKKRRKRGRGEAGITRK